MCYLNNVDRLKIKEKLFSRNGDLKIKCTATIDSVYWKSNEVSIQGKFKRNFPQEIHSGFWNSGFYIQVIAIYICMFICFRGVSCLQLYINNLNISLNLVTYFINIFTVKVNSVSFNHLQLKAVIQ